MNNTAFVFRTKSDAQPLHLQSQWSFPVIHKVGNVVNFVLFLCEG